MRCRALLALLVLVISPPAFSDGGMWTFQEFPHALLKREHGADVSSAWLDRVRTATIRLSNCTASFVSAEGLILTNHHCAEACLDEHSTSEQNLVTRRASSPAPATRSSSAARRSPTYWWAWRTCPRKCRRAIHGLDDKAANETRKKTLARLEQACEESSKDGRGRRATSASRSICTRAGSTGSTSTAATTTCGWCSRPSAA